MAAAETQEEVLSIFKETGALITGSHIVGTSGRHMADYFNKDAVYPHTEKISRIGQLIAQLHKEKNIEVVVGPAVGGIIISQWTAHHLSRFTKREVLGTFTEKTPENNQVFKRGYEKFVAGKRVLIVEDVTTTGGSVKKVVERVRQAGGDVVAVTVMVNRDSARITSGLLGAPFFPLVVMETPSYAPEECPMCKENMPMNTTVGHGKNFFKEKATMQ
jgi:orotate phosphoribosyltransferase